MELSLFRTRRIKIIVAMLALAICTSTVQAANLLTATPATVTLTCSTTSGPSAAVAVVVKPVTALTGSNTIAVSLGALPGGVNVTPAGSTTLSTANQSAGLTYNVSLAAGCVGASTGTPNFRFATSAGADATVNLNLTVTSTTSGLSASPSSVSLVCVRTPGSPATYAPGVAQNVNVSSSATGGTPFTIDTTTNPVPGWVTLSSTSGGTATSATPVQFSVSATAGCGGFGANTTNTATIHLLNAPAPDKLINVILQVVPPTILQAVPNPASLTYTKGSGTAGYVDIRITAPSVTTPPFPFFSVDTTSLPIWLNVDATTGTVPKNIRFSSTTVADSLAPGNYSATVRLNVTGYGPLSIPISLLVTNPTPKLSVVGGTTQNMSWTVGQALPAPSFTLVSSDSPISYSIATGGTLAPAVPSSMQKGLAYNFGTAIPITFNPLVFAAATPGTTLTGTVTITWGNPAATIVVTFNVNVQSPGATLTGITPASIPTASAGQTFMVALTGTGFVPSTDPLQKTKVGVVVTGNTIVADTNIAVNVQTTSTIILTFTVPATADPNLPFANGGNVVLGVCNPSGSTCSTASATATLSIGSNPIISAVTSASAFVQVTPPALQTIAPYDLLSIFGSNFCPPCSSNQILAGTPDPTTKVYPTTVSPDATGPTQRNLTVSFLTHGTTTVVATAPILFATNNQINFVVPGSIPTGSSIDIVVSFGYGTGTNLKSSSATVANVVATDPGIFTVGSDGQGDGAILDQTWSTVGQTNPAGMRTGATDSDVVQIFMTGLGAPDSTADNASAGSGPAAAWSADCVSPATFRNTLNATTGSSLTSLDGAIVQSSLLNTFRMVPCVDTGSSNLPTVTIGNVPATVLYAGWVADSIAGLYQINVRLPRNNVAFTTAAGTTANPITAPVQLPVVVTANSRSSQSNVTVWVAPRLLVTGPSGSGLVGKVGAAWASSNNAIVATEGTGPYQYIITSGVLPSGLSLTGGAITGTPALNTIGSYVITVTAIDSATIPVTGMVTFTLTVNGGLVMSGPGAPITLASGSANSSVTLVNATAGGVGPYSYTLTATPSVPTGLTVDPASGVIGITGSTPAGTYVITVTATDSTQGTPLTGTFTFTLTLT